MTIATPSLRRFIWGFLLGIILMTILINACAESRRTAPTSPSDSRPSLHHRPAKAPLPRLA